MKSTISISVLAVLLVTASRACFAVNVAMDISPERAKELGMEVRSYAAGPDLVGVVLQFQTEGALESYRRVGLVIQLEGKLLMSATLREEESSEGHIVVTFQADRGHLDHMTLVVETGDPLTTPFGNRVAYQLQVQDFIDLEKLREIDLGHLLDPLSGASLGDQEPGFSVQAPLARDAEAVNVHVSPEESFSNYHFTLHITVPGRVDQTLRVRNGHAVTRSDVRLVDVNGDGFLDLMIVGGADDHGQYWFKTWLFDQEAGEYRWIND